MSIQHRELPRRLDDKGRCCGRKPLVYKRPPRLYCWRCDRAYDPDDGAQIDSWAWKLEDGLFVCQTNRSDSLAKSGE